MTGFGRGIFESEELSVLVDVKSLNGRFLSIRLHSAQEIDGELDLKIRQKVSMHFLRGSIEIKINYRNQKPLEFEINHSLIKGFLQTVNKMKEEFNLPGELEVNSLVLLPKAIIPKQMQESKVLEEAIFHALEIALSQVERMRETEGSLLEGNILKHLKQVKKLTTLIERRVKRFNKERFQRLRDKVGELLSNIGLELDESRWLQEVVYLAERSDISEEVTRLKSHIEHAYSIISEKNDIGKRLDFLSQELMRETNTILSKAPDIEIKKLALQLKDEVEKIREQVQNVE